MNLNQYRRQISQSLVEHITQIEKRISALNIAIGRLRPYGKSYQPYADVLAEMVSELVSEKAIKKIELKQLRASDERGVNYSKY